MAQLDLWQVELDALPWQGQSPRDLTKARKALFLEQARQKDDRLVVDPNQLDLWPSAKKAPRIYRGAPLLLDLEGRTK